MAWARGGVQNDAVTAVAVIGGGLSGLAAARVLRGLGWDISVFEAGARLGGRSITESHGAALFDTGAQFFRTEAPAVEELVLQSLPATDLVDIRSEVRPFTADGAIGEGDPAQNGQPKWVYRRGIGQLGGLLARGSGAVVHLGWPCLRIQHSSGGWLVEGEAGRAGPFGAVVATLPPPALAPMIERSSFESGARQGLLAAIAPSRYRPIVSVTFGFHRRPVLPGDIYALVNTDRAHAVSWLAFEHRKAGYVPPGHGVLTAQMAADWSGPRLVTTDATLAAEALDSVRSLLEEAVPTPAWTHVTRWPAALPDVLVEAERLRCAEHLGLFVAGDCASGGRVHLALASGLEAGARLVSWMDSRR